ncbi:hypothetical protein EYA84_03910 [Verrucosispora sp. SN26_14.1]|uniref:hypothetical protein n=1 Tax=Verrucosispora sp. SN26_14.1 TaxID=2527879 RepID=UPI001033BCDC|nr:hypothetical protein [Verrucosispora sp. SN26_14.1]TBL42512.1 hypothetical protein EYA84_03910 [Verrucosispora sp. SN26_14.1]
MTGSGGGLTRAELADSIWLAARLGPGAGLAGPPDTTLTADPSRPDGGPPLSEVLHPFRQLVPGRERYEFDEDATAEHLAAGVAWPVLRRTPRAGWDAVVVVDDHLSMAVWSGRIRSFVKLLRRHVAFHDVRVCRLVTDTTDPAGVVLRGRRALRAAGG